MIDYNRIEYNISLAFDIELHVPDIIMSSLSFEEREELVLNENYILDESGQVFIEKINGIDVSYSQFWTGEKFLYYTTIINDRHLLNGGQGEELDANCLTCFADTPYPVNHCLKKLKPILKENMKDFTGFITLDVTLKDGKAYYRRINFKTKLDYLQAMASLNEMELDDMITKMEKGEEIEKPKGFGVSLRLHAYPYDIKENFMLKFPLSQFEIDLKLGDESYIVTAKAENINKAWKNLYNTIPIGVSKYACYRLDGDATARRIYNRLKREHYHPDEKIHSNNSSKPA